uniref:protein disulfide-isomerase n=1 Tax=Rhizophora mucronata TaxID=61149 RepID=A0A2P2MKQ9_RHIMU
MFCGKRRSSFILFTLTILLLLTFTISTKATEEDAEIDGHNQESRIDVDNNDDDELEELLAIDEQEEQEGEEPQQQGDQQKEAEVLSKAQRIVLELNTDSSRRVIEENEFVLVLGYAPWSARSAELMPQFAVAANKLKELGSSLVMAKLDGERYPKAASMIGIKGFPTLVLFVNGSSRAYTGGFSGEDIVIWARKRTGVPVIRISSATVAEEFRRMHQIFVLGLFEKFEGPAYEEFVKVATSDNELQFVELNDIAVAKTLFPDIKVTNHFIGIVKSEPERYTAYEGSYEKEKILDFLDHNKFPLVTKLTELNSARVYTSPVKLQVMIFAEDSELKNLTEPLQEVARKFKSKIMFINVDIADENLAKPFLTLFGLEDSENTVVAAFDNRISAKYLLESDPTASSIEEFCLRLVNDNLPPYFKSQPIPNNKDALVLAIVGKTFDELVLRNPMNVLLEVCMIFSIVLENSCSILLTWM